MPADAPTIVATSMGFNRAREPWRPGPVFACAFDLAGAGSRPRICLVATAGGDQAATIDAFHQAFAGSGIRASHLALFDQPNAPDVREPLTLVILRSMVIMHASTSRAAVRRRGAGPRHYRGFGSIERRPPPRRAALESSTPSAATDVVHS